MRLIVEPSGARDGGWSRRLCLNARVCSSSECPAGASRTRAAEKRDRVRYGGQGISAQDYANTKVTRTDFVNARSAG